MAVTSRSGALAKQAKSLLRSDVAWALLRTFATRGIASVGSFLLVVLLGRMYGAVGVGVYALAQSLIMAIAVIGRWGMNGALIRFVGRDLRSPKIYAYVRYALLRAGVISTVGMVAVFLLRGVFAHLFHTPALGPFIVGIALAIPPFVLAFILSGFMSAVRKPATACLLQNGAIAFVTVLLVLGMHALWPHQGLILFGIGYAVAAWLVCIWGLWNTWRWLWRRDGGRVSITREDVVEFNRSSAAFFAANVASFLLGVVGIWAAGYWLPTASVGLYKAARQMSMLIGVILSVINLIIPTRFAHSFHRGNLAGLERLAKRGVMAGLMLGIVPLVVCLAFPRWILSLAGSDFASAALVLQVLALGQLINLGCGSVGHILNMTGHEGISSRIAWFANIMGLLMIVVGTPYIGVIAVAIGVAMGISLRKLMGVYFVWRILGVWTLPIPNLLRLSGVSARRGSDDAGKQSLSLCDPHDKELAMHEKKCVTDIRKEEHSNAHT